jgi:alkaline phosphatase D
MLSHLQSKPLKSFAFASCNRQDYENNFWNLITKKSPDLFVWLGDVVYADEMDIRSFKWNLPPIHKVQEKYNLQKRKEEYTKLVENVPVIGIWDDHDYGMNNGGRDNPDKVEMQKVVCA